MMKRSMAATAMLLLASCMQNSEVKPTSAATVKSDAEVAAEQKAAADAAAAKKAADEKAVADKAAAEAADKLSHATVSLTTRSPEAAAAFNLGFEWFSSVHYAKGADEFRRALGLDDGFLLPQSYLALNTPGADAMKKNTAVAEAGASLPEAERTELQMNAAYKQGDDSKGDSLAAKLVALAPGDWRAQIIAGNDALQARKLDAATAAYHRALELNPGSFVAHSLLAQVANLKGDHDGEIAEEQKAIAARPGEAALQDDLAVSLISAGRFDDAAAALDVEKKMASAGYEVHASLSAVDILRGDLAGGIKEARAAMDLAKAPTVRSDLEYGLAFAQMFAKKHADALKTAAALEKEAKAANDPNGFIDGGVCRALVQLDQGKPAPAIASLNEALDRTDKEPLSTAGRQRSRRVILELSAWIDASLGKASEAQAAADLLTKEIGAAADADKDAASMISFAQGQALVAKGDGAGAIAAMSKCVPQDDLCHWALASAQEKAGDNAGAEATRSAYLALNRSSAWGLWVRTRIAPPVKTATKATNPAAKQ